MTALAPRLVIPEGWLVDRATAARLARQLDRAPMSVSGIVAVGGPLLPGASYRVHAERRSLRPLDDVAPWPSRSVAGVALVRPGVEAHAGRGVVEVPAGGLLADAGAHAHDPMADPGPLLAATVAARPPFPWRPVVAFVALGPGPVPDLAVITALVDGLVLQDVEARVVVPAGQALTSGPHLTRPCRADLASLGALAPEVVVALDGPALDLARVSSPLGRGTTVIEWVGGGGSIELVPWRIGVAAGRVRARVGADADPAAAADLVRRLVAGPQPVPPSLPFGPQATPVGLTPRKIVPAVTPLAEPGDPDA